MLDLVIRMGIIDDLIRALFGKKKPKKIINKIRQTLDNKSDDYSLLTWLDLEDYQCTKEEYIERGRNNSLPAFAILKDSAWYEKGSMGWWGCVSNEKDESIWDKEITKLLKEVDGDTLITIVDCHI